jgi:hypothetical protein
VTTAFVPCKRSNRRRPPQIRSASRSESRSRTSFRTIAESNQNACCSAAAPAPPAQPELSRVPPGSRAPGGWSDVARGDRPLTFAVTAHKSHRRQLSGRPYPGAFHLQRTKPLSRPRSLPAMAIRTAHIASRQFAPVRASSRRRRTGLQPLPTSHDT